MHFHDTYGQALANTYAALQAGITTYDASAGGLGGCPYAKSATGNLATEDLVWMLTGLGIETGVDLEQVVATSVWMAGHLGRPSPSAVVRALALRRPGAGCGTILAHGRRHATPRPYAARWGWVAHLRAGGYDARGAEWSGGRRARPGAYLPGRPAAGAAAPAQRWPASVDRSLTRVLEAQRARPRPARPGARRRRDPLAFGPPPVDPADLPDDELLRVAVQRDRRRRRRRRAARARAPSRVAAAVAHAATGWSATRCSPTRAAPT